MTDSGQPTAGEWLEMFAHALPAGTQAVPDAEEQRLILDLSRIAAHASERIAAPIASYMVGVAFASLSRTDRASAIRRLIDALTDGIAS